MMHSELEVALNKYDCILSAIFITSERVTAVDFQLPHAPFGFQVMSRVPATAEAKVVDRIIACLRPFSMGVWLTILGLVVLSAILIGTFEGGWGEYCCWRTA